MIVVDSSVWIDFLNKVDNVETGKLLHVESARDILVGDLVLFEILRGARDDSHARRLEKQLRVFEIRDILNEVVAIQAAENYRRLRAVGITVRKIADVVIGTYCIMNGHSLLHRDRDFLPMVEHLGLREF
jgi:predicted nucleic acid-binding protein